MMTVALQSPTLVVENPPTLTDCLIRLFVAHLEMHREELDTLTFGSITVEANVKHGEIVLAETVRQTITRHNIEEILGTEQDLAPVDDKSRK